ncbi:MAG: hypothetical protein Q9166_001438 [cf. Caloplaca sp. 2 TL-2023]
MAVGGDLGLWGPEGAMKVMWYLVGTTTVWSGASYIYTKDAVKILTSRKASLGNMAGEIVVGRPVFMNHVQ